MSCTLADALVYYVLCSVVCCYDETVSAARSSMRESVFFRSVSMLLTARVIRQKARINCAVTPNYRCTGAHRGVALHIRSVETG